MKNKLSGDILFRKKYLTNKWKRRKDFTYHPESLEQFSDKTETKFSVFQFSADSIEDKTFAQTDNLIEYLKQNDRRTGFVSWIDISGINPESLKKVGQYFQIHPLLIEDILSFGQRAKADDMGNQIFALLPMLFYDQEKDLVDLEQLCVLLMDGYVLSFHNNVLPEYFSLLKNKIKKSDSLVRNNRADYLFYLVLDTVVDHYFDITDTLSDQIDQMEDRVINNPKKSVLFDLTVLRHKVMFVKRGITPVRELINSFWVSDNALITPVNKKYFKNVYDHIILAVEYSENYRELIINLQDLYMNQVNAKLNEVMKILTIITALLAPFAVISGIYGMNFNRIPFTSAPEGFFISILFMIGVSALMLLYFRRKGWF